MIAGTIPSLVRDGAGRAGALLSVLADPDAQPPRTRAATWLAWAALLSVALHAAALSMIGTVPIHFDGQLHLALNARLLPPAAAPAVPAADATTAAQPRALERAAQAAAPAGAEAARGTTLPQRYFTVREVDAPAALLEQPTLVYPEDPYLWQLPGKVRLRVLISAEGTVDAVEVVSAQPPGHFEEAALAAGRALRYRAARIGAQAVPSQKTIDVEFDPHEHLRPARDPDGRAR